MAQFLMNKLSEIIEIENDKKEESLRCLRVFVRIQLLSILDKCRTFIIYVEKSLSRLPDKNAIDLVAAFQTMKKKSIEFLENTESFKAVEENTAWNIMRLTIMKFTRFKSGIKEFYFEVFEVFSIMIRNNELKVKFDEYKLLFCEILEKSVYLKDAVFRSKVEYFENLNIGMKSHFDNHDKKLADNLHCILKETIYYEYANSIARLILNGVVKYYEYPLFFYEFEQVSEGKMNIENYDLQFLNSLIHPSLNGQSFELLRVKKCIENFLSIASQCSEGSEISIYIKPICDELTDMYNIIGDCNTQNFLNNFYLMNKHGISDFASLVKIYKKREREMRELVNNNFRNMPNTEFMNAVTGNLRCINHYHFAINDILYFCIFKSFVELKIQVVEFEVWVLYYPSASNKMISFSKNPQEGDFFSCRII